MTEAIFVPEGGRFAPTERSGSPWADHLVHGGPANGLLARAIERFETDSEMAVARLTIDLFRPVPKAPLAVTVRTVRAGRRIHVVEASLIDGDVEVCRATGLLLRRGDVATVPPSSDPIDVPAGPDGIDTTPLAARGADQRPRREGFHTTIEARWVSRREQPGPNVAWLRLPVPLVAGEPLSPLVRAAATADFVNPLTGGRGGSINVDTTLYLQREPVGEWIGMQVERQVEPHGNGVARAVLFDTAGAFGSAAQAVLANQMR